MPASVFSARSNAARIRRAATKRTRSAALALAGVSRDSSTTRVAGPCDSMDTDVVTSVEMRDAGWPLTRSATWRHAICVGRLVHRHFLIDFRVPAAPAQA